MADGRAGAARAICAAVQPVVILVVATLAAGCSADSSAAPSGGARPEAKSTTVEVSTGNCGRGWTSGDARGGVQQFQLRNTGDLPVQADLVDPKSGAVYAEAEGIGPGTSRSVHLNVARGRYAFRCIPTDGSAGIGPTVLVTSGPRHGGDAVIPVSPAELLAAVRAYSTYVEAGLRTLRARAERLRAASNDRPAAQQAWLPAHAAYESLGAAYGAFGDYAEAIDGIRANGQAPASGFHRIEFLLWHGAPMQQVRAACASLVRVVRALQKNFPDQRIDSNDLGLRAHEILEATVQFELTGDSDEGSGTNLATADANITGTEAVLRALTPALRTRYSQLPRVHKALDHLRTLIRAQTHRGRWTAVPRLGRADRQRIDAAAGAAVELLASVATITAVRQTE